MKKDIYIIKNKINNLVYIGQAVNTVARWAGHRSAAKHSEHPILIDKAIKELGVENFWYEIIETVENYDEREMYWISYYNCKTPNGYNVLDGGEGGQAGIHHPRACIKSEEEINNIIDEIVNSNKKLKDIALDHGVALRVISSINRGIVYKNNDLTYPLRKRAADSMDFDVDELINDLINTQIPFNKLVEKYNTSSYIIKEINKGNKYFNENYSYPLRTKEINPTPDKIRNLLKTTSLSMHEIARQCNVAYSTVAQLNYGKYHRLPTEHYPIRVTR